MDGLAGGWLAGALDEGFSPRNIALLLWVGLAVLTLSLLVLARTRWGQAKPLSKCVILSLYAHFLLGGYAYTTQVILEPPPLRYEPVMRLTHVSDRPERDERSPDQRSDAAAPWERLADDAVVKPEREAPQRRATAADPEPTRRAEVAAPMALALAPTDVPPSPEATPERPTPAIPTPPMTVIPTAAATEIEQPPAPLPPSEEVVPSRLAAPSASGLARAEVATPESLPMRRPGSTASPNQFAEPMAGFQRLADALPADAAQAVRGERDELASAANRDANASGATRENVASPGNGNPHTGATLSSSAPFSAVVAALPIPRRLGDGAEMPDLYRLRVGEGRASIARQLGATPETEAAVEAALRWFAARQNADGRWSAAAHGAGREDKVLGHDRSGAGGRADTAITALALLSFLGAGHTHLEGPYAKNVQRGFEYLLRTQRADGDLSGDAEFFARMYCHGMASLAMSEALAMTGDARIKPFVERAVAFSLACQHPTNGGWRYQKGDLGDMSQFGWQVMALKSADLAGISLPQATRDGMQRFLRGVSSGAHGGLASYRAGERPSRTMTAEALACRYFLDGEPAPNLRREAVAFLLEEPPQAGRPNFYYWYYGTLALHQAQDDPWAAWNAALQQQLLTRQRRDGDAAGSWDPDCIWGGYGGRCYTTAMACLCLEVYYRYLPITAQ